MVGHVLQPRPHVDPPVFGDLPESGNQVVGLESVVGGEEEGELRVVELILEGELNVVADNHGDAVADNGVKEAA